MPHIILVKSPANVMKMVPSQDEKHRPENSTEIKTRIEDKALQLAKPLAVAMSLFGLLFLSCKKSKWYLVQRAYSVFVLMLMGTRFLQLFFAYRDEQFGGESLFKALVHLWYLQNCVNAVVTYKAYNNENRFEQFLLKWSRLLSTNRGISPQDTSFSTAGYERGLNRKLKLSLATAWIMVFVCVATHGFFLFNCSKLDFTIAPVQPSQFFAIPMKVIVTIVDIYMASSWVFTLAMFYLISVVIYKEFEIFNNDLRKAVSPDGDIKELEWFRRRHEDICDVVETADDILSAFNAAGIFICTTEAMLLMYSTVAIPRILADPLSLASHCIWFMEMLLYYVLIACGGGYLNHIAHAPLKTIHRVRIKDVTPEFSLQITMFLDKLSGEPIGLTALDLFVIDKSTILTIAGAFITYFIVLVQFQQPTSAVQPFQCNCTEFLTNSTLECSVMTTI